MFELRPTVLGPVEPSPDKVDGAVPAENVTVPALTKSGAASIGQTIATSAETVRTQTVSGVVPDVQEPHASGPAVPVATMSGGAEKELLEHDESPASKKKRTGAVASDPPDAPASEATSSMVACFESISPTVTANQAMQREEAERTAQTVRDRLALNKAEADAQWRSGTVPATDDDEWQSTHRAIFNANQCGILDATHPDQTIPYNDIIELFVILRKLHAVG
jgi:hypothetical protein